MAKAAGGEIFYCPTHKDTRLITINDQADLSSLGVRELRYCPATGCKYFRVNEGGDTWDDVYSRFDLNPLPYMTPTQEQRILQRFLRRIFILTVRVEILEDKGRRHTIVPVEILADTEVIDKSSI